VHEVGAQAAQPDRQAELLEQQLGSGAAAAQHPIGEIRALGQAAEQIAGMPPPTAQLPRIRVAGIDDDGRHGVNDARPDGTVGRWGLTSRLAPEREHVLVIVPATRLVADERDGVA